MSLQFTTTGKHILSQGIKTLVHGLSGAGKTVLCSTAPAPIILSAEAGTLSIAKQNIPMIIIGSMKDLVDAREFFQTSAHAKQFLTVCLDSISEMAEKLLSEERKKSKDPRQAYGEMADQIAVQLRMFRDLPGVNVYFSCKSHIQDQPDNTRIFAPMMPGKQTAQGLPYYFDEVFYLGVGSYLVNDKPVTYRFLQTNLDTLAYAKDRSGALDPQEPPDLTKVFNKIRAAHAVG
jgi:hypothetical protein